ncbi:MAG: anaerobic sulfatase maturase [Saccharofermentanales bacterium]|jgi:uncharacterized protein
MKKTHNLQLLIKPASSSCNIRCTYCFYYDICSIREEENYGIMTDQVLETLIRKSFANAEGQVSIVFQGGEPTLAGLTFFEKYISLIQKYNKNNLPVNHGIQTNGMILNREWAEFFKRHSFLVGVSVDGVKESHNAFRLDAKGEGTFDQVWASIKLLQKYQVDFNVLTVINAATAVRAKEIYNFYKENGLRYQQYIPCLNPLENPDFEYPFTLTNDLYAKFLCELFDVWYQDVICGNLIYVSNFENYLAMLLGVPPGTCGMTGHCTPHMVVEADGSFYPCDFYVLDEYKIGNIMQDDYAEIEQRLYSTKLLEESKPIAEPCKKCRYFKICRGGCRRHREPLIVDGSVNLNRFCKAYKQFFDYAVPRLKHLGSKIL